MALGSLVVLLKRCMTMASITKLYRGGHFRGPCKNGVCEHLTKTSLAAPHILKPNLTTPHISEVFVSATRWVGQPGKA